MTSNPPTLSKRIYRTLLRLYPSQFHDEFGSEMAADFDDAADEAWLTGGWPCVLSLWNLVVADLAGALLRQWFRTGLPLLIVLSAACSTLLFALIAHQFVPLQRSLWPIPPDAPGQSLVLLVLALAGLPVLIVVIKSWFRMRILSRSSRML